MAITEKEQTTFLNDLGGNEREIKMPKSTKVDLFMKLLNDLFDNKLIQLEKNNMFTDNLYLDLYKCISDKLKNITINKDDLKSFIYTSAPLDLDLNKYVLRGGLSGTLLQLLSERTDKFTFYINGYNMKYDYLFFEANLKENDNLIIDNFEGDNICASLLHSKSKPNLIAFLNCKGEEIGSYMGYGKCNINHLYLINNHSDHSLYKALLDSNVNNLYVINNKGFG
ncbi:hypothetical protein ACFL1H_05475, partial [Nanoarchaeota archaeon]